MVSPDALWSPLTSTRWEPERRVSIQPSRFSAASTRAAFAMPQHGRAQPCQTAARTRLLSARSTLAQSSRRSDEAICDDRQRAHCQIMTTDSELIPIPSKLPTHVPGPLRLAVAAHPACRDTEAAAACPESRRARRQAASSHAPAYLRHNHARCRGRPARRPDRVHGKLHLAIAAVVFLSMVLGLAASSIHIGREPRLRPAQRTARLIAAIAFASLLLTDPLGTRGIYGIMERGVSLLGLAWVVMVARRLRRDQPTTGDTAGFPDKDTQRAGSDDNLPLSLAPDSGS